MNETMPPAPFATARQKPTSGVITPERNQNALASRFCSITKHLHHLIINQLHAHRSFVSSEPFATPPFKAGSEAKRFRDETTPLWVFNPKGGFILVK